MYSNNDWRSYQKKNDDELIHSWGTSPEQRRRASEYNHQYWLENRERIMRRRAARAAGRDFESELAEANAELSRLNYENYQNRVSQDQEQKKINSQYSMDDVNQLNRSADIADSHGSPQGDNLRARARGIERMNDFYSTKNQVNARITNNRNFSDRLVAQNNVKKIQREYDAAYESYKNTPIAKISNLAASIVEKGKLAVASVLDSLSGMLRANGQKR